MVAFLRRLPQLEPAEFRRLAYGEGTAVPAAGAHRLEPRLPDCARCHGRDGTGRGTGAFPALAGQSERYLLESLQAYARGDRHSGIMGPVAAGLSGAEMRAIARHYAGLPVEAGPAAASLGEGRIAAEAAPTGAGGRVRAPDQASVARGGRLAQRGDAAARIPSCVECHGPGTAPRNPVYPRLAGQHPDYLALQLRLFKQGRRGGSGYAHIMRTVAKSLEPRDIRDLAAWYGSLPAQPVPGEATSTPPASAPPAPAGRSAGGSAEAP